MNRFEKALHYIRELLVIGMAAAVIALVFYAVPVLNHAVLLLDEVKQDGAALRSATDSARGLIDNADDNLNTEPFGVLPQAKLAAKHTAAAARQIAKTSLAEKKAFAEQTAKVNEVLDGLKGDTKALDALLVSVGTDLGSLVGHATPVLDESKQMIADADELWKDPNIRRAILELANSGKNIDEVTASLAGIASDVQGRVHTLTHPSKVQRTISGTLTALKTLYYMAVALK